MRKYNEISRRGFLRSAVLAGTGICASSVFNGMVAGEGGTGKDSRPWIVKLMPWRRAYCRCVRNWVLALFLIVR